MLSSFYKNTKNQQPAKREQLYLLPLMDDKPFMDMAVKLAQLKAGRKDLSFIRLFYFKTSVDFLYVTNWVSRQFAGYRADGPTKQNWLLQQYGFKRDQLVFSNILFYFKNYRRKKLKSKFDLINLNINGVKVGDLIYDHYLRFKSKPTVDIDDPALYDLIDYTTTLCNKLEGFLKKNTFECIIVPYGAYVQWGTIVRVGVKMNVPVYTYGNSNYILQKATLNHPFHRADQYLFHDLFKKIQNDKRLPLYLERAKNVLEERLIGIIDSSLAYMRTSAYGKEQTAVFDPPADKPFAIIFSHCFFDSPHIYGDMLFPDFYEWIGFILSEAKKVPGVNFYLKLHPNGLEGNAEIIEELISMHPSPNIFILPASTNNRAILEKKPSAIFSVYGTVCHEFAYCGIPVVTAGDNPHSQYKFLYQPASIEEFSWFVKNVGNYGLPEEYHKEDIVEFFFMNYMFFSEKYHNAEMVTLKDFTTGEISFDMNLKDDELVYNANV